MSKDLLEDKKFKFMFTLTALKAQTYLDMLKGLESVILWSLQEEEHQQKTTRLDGQLLTFHMNTDNGDRARAVEGRIKCTNQYTT